MAIVYQHVRLDTNLPFYVGMGKELKRAYNLDPRNRKYKDIIKITDIRVDVLYDNLSWEEACEKERELIKTYGRTCCEDRGILTNMNLGGDGHEHFKHSQETKDKISNTKKGRIPWNKGKVGSMKGNKMPPMSEETKKKISVSKTGFKHSENSKKTFSDARKGEIRRKEWGENISKALKGRKRNST